MYSPLKMMLKAIYKHTKPLKHTKNIETLTNYSNKNTIFSKLSQNGKTFQKLPFSYFACTFVWIFPTFLKIQNLLQACVLIVFAIFTYPPFGHFFFFHFFHTKRKFPYSKWRDRAGQWVVPKLPDGGDACAAAAALPSS